jgi:hypothetical protein
MPSAWTSSDSLADSLNTVVASARQVNEYEGVMTQLVDVRRLSEGDGLDWREISLAKLTAQGITETTDLDNPQEITDALITVTPTGVGINWFITDRAVRRVSKITLAQIGGLGMNAMIRRKDTDGLTQLDSFSGEQPGAGATLTTGHISAHVVNVRGNTTEPWNGPVAMVAHSFQYHDVYSDLVSGLGTYPIPEGPTARVFQGGVMTLAGINTAGLFTDDNLQIDGNDDAKGGVFASGTGGAIVLVEDAVLKAETKRRPERGGGGDEFFLYHWYAYGERLDSWGREVYSDATAPTS